MEKPSSARVALKWGIISSIISIIFTVIAYNTDLWKEQLIMSLTGAVISLTILYFAMTEFKGLNEGFMTLGQGIGLGMLVITISGLISTSFSIFYTNYFDTSFKDKLMDFQEEQLMERGLSDDQLAMAMEQTEKFSTPGFQFLFALIFILIFGFILSLIMGAIVKKNRPVFE